MPGFMQQPQRPRHARRLGAAGSSRCISFGWSNRYTVRCMGCESHDLTAGVLQIKVCKAKYNSFGAHGFREARKRSATPQTQKRPLPLHRLTRASS